jgi:hypothetical protein
MILCNDHQQETIDDDSFTTTEDVYNVYVVSRRVLYENDANLERKK